MPTAVCIQKIGEMNRAHLDQLALFGQYFLSNSRRAKKSNSIKNIAYLLTTIERYYIKFYTLVTHSLPHKSGTFYCIIYQIMLLLLMTP